MTTKKYKIIILTYIIKMYEKIHEYFDKLIKQFEESKNSNSITESLNKIKNIIKHYDDRGIPIKEIGNYGVMYYLSLNEIKGEYGITPLLNQLDEYYLIVYKIILNREAYLQKKEKKVNIKINNNYLSSSSNNTLIGGKRKKTTRKRKTSTKKKKVTKKKTVTRKRKTSTKKKVASKKKTVTRRKRKTSTKRKTTTRRKK